MSKVTVEELNLLVSEIFETKAKVEVLDLQTTELNKEVARKEQKCIEYLKELNLETFAGTHGRVTPVETQSYKIPATDEERDAFFNYLKSEGVFDGLMTVNYATLNSWAKKWYEAAKERGDLGAFIPGLGAPTIAYKLHKTKAKGAKSEN